MSEDGLQIIMYILWFVAIILELKSIRHILEEINEKQIKKLDKKEKPRMAESEDQTE